MGIPNIFSLIKNNGVDEFKEYIQQKLYPSASSSGPKVKGRGKPRAKRIARAKTLPVIEEEIELIAPPQMGVNYLDIMNDPYLINKIN